MQKFVQEVFQLDRCGTTIKQELLAGIISFFANIYIVVVNATILADAGIPEEAGIIATLLICFTGCLLVAFWGNTPLILVPGMGINAMFSYTIVQSMVLSWQEALAAVFLSGVIFMIIAFTRLSEWITKAIPRTLVEAIPVGIGLFLTLIGLQKGGIVILSETTFVTIGHLGEPAALVTLLTLIVAIVLYIRDIPGNFLISMAAGTGLAAFFGLFEGKSGMDFHIPIDTFLSVFGALSFAKIGVLSFWIAVFSLSIILVFENMGLVYGQTRMIGSPEKFRKSYQAVAVSSTLSGVVGSSPSVSAVESAAGIAAGGRSGLTALVTAVGFAASLPFIPLLKWIPNSAVAPILIIIGSIMLQNIKQISFDDFTEGFPAFLIIVLIPFTYSIADGIAFGFLAYVLVKLASGKRQEIPTAMYGIAGGFLLNFILHAIQ